MDEISNILDELENIQETKPLTIKEALEIESHKLYLYYCLEITEQKLTNKLNRKTIDKMQSLKNVFEMAKKTYDIEDEAVFLENLYK